jgi:hypothetical protein
MGNFQGIQYYLLLSTLMSQIILPEQMEMHTPTSCTPSKDFKRFCHGIKWNKSIKHKS